MSANSSRCVVFAVVVAAGVAGYGPSASAAADDPVLVTAVRAGDAAAARALVDACDVAPAAVDGRRRHWAAHRDTWAWRGQLLSTRAPRGGSNRYACAIALAATTAARRCSSAAGGGADPTRAAGGETAS